MSSLYQLPSLFCRKEMPLPLISVLPVGLVLVVDPDPDFILPSHILVRNKSYGSGFETGSDMPLVKNVELQLCS
jgi:hypothetical protein